MSCAHPRFDSTVAVQRITRVEQGSGTWFIASVRVRCAWCHEQFAFLGLPTGFDLHGAAASIDGAEVALAIAPIHDVQALPDAKLGRVTVRRPS